MMKTNIRFSSWLLLWSWTTAGVAMPNFARLLEQLTGQLPVAESVDSEMQRAVMLHFLHPAPRPLQDAAGNYLPAVQMLFKHLGQIRNTEASVAGVIRDHVPVVYNPFAFKNFVSYRDYSDNLRMGPQTSFYFYLSMLALVRDLQMDAEGTADVLTAAPFFSAEQPLTLRKTLMRWATDGSSADIEEEGELERNTIYSQILAHRAAYYELLAHRFIARNGRLDGWGSHYRGTGPEDHELRRLGSSQDSWDKVQAELVTTRAAFGNQGFAYNVASQLKTSLDKLIPAAPAPKQPAAFGSPVTVYEEAYSSEDEADNLLRRRTAAGH
ncbi:MAG: hypothetical protein OXT67_02470 [Zetaproteobacteria bacterium]|nr:hypothetical protein [Zetaproteobacteria bacterium]